CRGGAVGSRPTLGCGPLGCATLGCGPLGCGPLGCGLLGCGPLGRRTATASRTLLGRARCGSLCRLASCLPRFGSLLCPRRLGGASGGGCRARGRGAGILQCPLEPRPEVLDAADAGQIAPRLFDGVLIELAVNGERP